MVTWSSSAFTHTMAVYLSTTHWTLDKETWNSTQMVDIDVNECQIFSVLLLHAWFRPSSDIWWHQNTIHSSWTVCNTPRRHSYLQEQMNWNVHCSWYPRKSMHADITPWHPTQVWQHIHESGYRCSYHEERKPNKLSMFGLHSFILAETIVYTDVDINYLQPVKVQCDTLWHEHELEFIMWLLFPGKCHSPKHDLALQANIFQLLSWYTHKSSAMASCKYQISHIHHQCSRINQFVHVIHQLGHTLFDFLTVWRRMTDNAIIYVKPLCAEMFGWNFTLFKSFWHKLESFMALRNMILVQFYQDTSSHDIDYVEWVGPCINWGRISTTCVKAMWRSKM